MGRTSESPLGIEVLFGPKGLSAQRNRIVSTLSPDDIVLFIDDDFIMSPEYMNHLDSIFSRNPGIVMVTGNVIANGARGPGIPLEEGRELIDVWKGSDEDSLTDVFCGFGCNMAFRMAPVAANQLRFDEDLPLYGWLEDMDFSRGLASFGRIVRSDAAYGVHLGTKVGRVSGVRLGYSQVANPIHLYKKGRIPWSVILSHAGKNILTNTVRSLSPESYVDRRGRLRGNLLALFDLLRGKLHPTKISKLS